MRIRIKSTPSSYSKSDLTITGTGALNVKGAYRNGIVSKELFFNPEDGKKQKIDCVTAATDDGLQFSFELPAAYIGLPIANLHFESTEDCVGGTVKITKIRLYGESAE